MSTRPGLVGGQAAMTREARLREDVQDVVIIGAGACGLATAHRLVQWGIRPLVLDQAQRVAEPWRRRHPQLRMNTHRRFSGLPGLPLPRSVGAFAGRDDVIDYLEAYQRRLAASIRYGTKVERIDRAGGHWRVQTTAGSRLARHVVVATGRERVAFMPAWPGIDEYRGRIIHAADFGRACDYRDQRVLVDGAGNSGADVLNHLARVETRRLWLVVRRGAAVLPVRLAGFPVHRLAALMSRLPVRLVDALLAGAQRLACGDLRRFGLPRHPHGAATRLLREGVAPAADEGFVAALKAGRVTPVAAVRRFEPAAVQLVDASALQPDVVICATGYRPGLEGMLGHLAVLDERGLPRSPEHECYADVPGLWLTGMWPRLEGTFYAASVESRRIARAIADRR